MEVEVSASSHGEDFCEGIHGLESGSVPSQNKRQTRGKQESGTMTRAKP